MPWIGLGIGSNAPKSWNRDEMNTAVATAAELGLYLDSAGSYGNEAAVGEALANIQKKPFVSSKLPAHQWHDVEARFNETLRALGLERLDLYLIHQPYLLDPGTQ